MNGHCRRTFNPLVAGSTPARPTNSDLLAEHLLLLPKSPPCRGLFIFSLVERSES